LRRSCIALVLALAAGCSSGHSSTSPTTPTTSPKRAAIALGYRLLDEALLPAGAERSHAPAPRLLDGPSTPGIGNLELAHRLWTVGDDPRAVDRWLQGHAPPGFKRVESDSGTANGVPSWGLEDDLVVNPPNITTAELQFHIVGDASGHAVVRADTVVGWAEPRLPDELVPARDRVVILTVVHVGGVPGKRVVVTDQSLVRPIVRAFNRLRVSPPREIYGCGLIGPHTVSYQIGFTTSPTATPRIVATIVKCGHVGVTVDGRAAPGLGDFVNAAFADSVAHVLGLSEPHFG
jgi:hypothetical protein